jgi:hypothetical protein
MIDEDVHQRVKPPRLRELFAGYRNGKAAPAARKTPKKTATKKTPKKTAVSRKSAGRKERVGAR